MLANVTHVVGINNIKAGVTYQPDLSHGKLQPRNRRPKFQRALPGCQRRTGICRESGVNNPGNCAGAASTNAALYPTPFVANPGFDSLLGCYDLTRSTPSPADGCASSTTGLYAYHGHTDIKELALYIQDSITIKNWSLNLGLRGDLYNGLVVAHQAEPRVGVAYNIKRTNTILRISYARTLESPFNENLVLSSTGCANAVLNPLLACSQPASAGATPFNPGYRNDFHAGLQQALGKYAVISGDYIWKYTHNAYDFSVLGATPITFPIDWHNSKIPGYAVRVSGTGFPWLLGVDGFL